MPVQRMQFSVRHSCHTSANILVCKQELLLVAGYWKTTDQTGEAGAGCLYEQRPFTFPICAVVVRYLKKYLIDSLLTHSSFSDFQIQIRIVKMGGGEKKASIVAKIMQLEFTGNRILVGFILAFDVLQNLLAMSLQHSYLRRLLLMIIAALLSQASYLTGQVYSCPSASERHLISMPTTSGLRGRQITSGMLRCP